MFKEIFENMIKGRKNEKQRKQRKVFRSAMEQLQHICSMDFYECVKKQGVDISYKEYQIDVIEYFMSLIRKELSSCARARFLLGGESGESAVDCCEPLPECYYSRTWERNWLCTEKEELICKKLNTETYIVPWKNQRVVKNFFCLRGEKWKFVKSNHRAWYYEELGLLYMYNGLHSSSTFVNLEKEAEVLAYHVSLKDVFPCLRTDGAFWEHVFVGREEEVEDVRFAVLYEFARKKAELLEMTE